MYPANIYLFKVNDTNPTKKSEICLNLTSSRDGTGSIVAEKKLDSSFHETQFLLEGMRKSYIKDASAKKVAY